MELPRRHSTPLAIYLDTIGAPRVDPSGRKPGPESESAPFESHFKFGNLKNPRAPATVPAES